MKQTAQDVVKLPRRGRGRPSPSADAIYRANVASWCALILEINSSMDFSVGARGWCYILENRNALRKGDFDVAEKLITDCRKSGSLPLDICAEDAARETIGLEEITGNTVGEEAESWIDHLRNHAHESYTPISFWDDLDTYVEMEVEKLDLRNLFEPACKEFYVPLTNFKGWSDLNARANMMRRFKQREGEGKKCVLLLCTDLDPGGLHMHEKMRKNFEDLFRAVGWSPENLVIIRFGLDAKFINRHRLTWAWRPVAVCSSTIPIMPTSLSPMCRATSRSSASGSARPMRSWSRPRSAVDSAATPFSVTSPPTPQRSISASLIAFACSCGVPSGSNCRELGGRDAP